MGGAWDVGYAFFDVVRQGVGVGFLWVVVGVTDLGFCVDERHGVVYAFFVEELHGVELGFL